jgi:hypothetical protein
MATSVNVCELYATSPLGFWAACRSSWPQSPPASNSVFFSSVRRSPAGSCCFCLGFLYLCARAHPFGFSWPDQFPSPAPGQLCRWKSVPAHGFVFRCSVPAWLCLLVQCSHTPIIVKALLYCHRLFCLPARLTVVGRAFSCRAWVWFVLFFMHIKCSIKCL